MPQSDWKFGYKEILGASRAEALGIDLGTGAAINRQVMDTGSLQAARSSNDGSEENPHPNYESTSFADSRPTEMSHIVNGRVKLDGMAIAHGVGYAGKSISSSGAKMAHHYEAKKDGRARGQIYFGSGLTGSPTELPEDPIIVTAGSSTISAQYHSASDSWSISGTLYTATGVEQINDTQNGFGGLSKSYSFDQAITTNSNFSIVVNISNATPGDPLVVQSSGSHTTCATDVWGMVSLNPSITP